MEDTLISFETAKLAKEKGFNFIYIIDNELTKHSLITQSLLAKWLREVHNIHLAVEPETFNPETDYISEIIILPRKFLKYRGKTYEEALEIALKCGLKLVEDELV